MLDPQSRVIYLDALHPPPGYVLDRAIATTFSLDLLSLLMAPLSMVFSAQGAAENINKDPIGFLESLQRIQDRLVVFCQAGRIMVPKVDTRLYSYLEPVVVEVQPPAGGVFHPKIWLLRFKPEVDNGDICYRLLCLSRNLTFDRSWDTLLSLEGYLDGSRQRGFGLNRPLAGFVQTLPSLILPDRVVSVQAQNIVDQLADEVARVCFEPPAPFDRIVAFKPVGIEGYKRLKFPKTYRRLLVVSPFLSGSLVRKLLSQGDDNVLISRPESLDELPAHLLAQLRINTNTHIYVMNELAERPDNEEVDADNQIGTGEDLSGLHAKLYIAENGWQARALTGSANATQAGFNGSNIEFLVELEGKRSLMGIDQFLGQKDQQASLLAMLQPYRQVSQTPTPEAIIRQELEQILEHARQTIITAGLSLSVVSDKDQTYTLTLGIESALALADPSIMGVCYPISRNREQGLTFKPLLSGRAVTFTQVSLEGLTSFIVFELTAQLENQHATLKFVLNLPIEGMPVERDQKVLQSLIADKNRFIRYLLFLLAEDKEFGIQDLLGWNETSGDNGQLGFDAGVPLLEELVRAASRQPDKIGRIAHLVDNLKQTTEGESLLPEGFDQIWEAFMKFHQQGQKQ